MKIAVLGWGSLIWDPRNLKIKSNEWQEDGPNMPIEFARISRNKRLTLVLYSKAEKVQVLWNYTDVMNLDEAVENLREREGTVSSRIGFVEIKTGRSRCSVIPIKDEIAEWAKEKGIDAVIWTDLSSNFKDKTDQNLDEKTVLNYLENLSPDEKENAKIYIKKAPKQIKTRIRKIIEENLGWTYERKSK